MEEFKKGDKVICIPRKLFPKQDPGAGYIEGKQFIIKSIYNGILWPPEGNGIYPYAVRKLNSDYEIY